MQKTCIPNSCLKPKLGRGGVTALAFPLDVAIGGGGGGCNSLSVGVVAIRIKLFKTREKDDHHLVTTRLTIGWVFYRNFRKRLSSGNKITRQMYPYLST